MTIGGMGWPTDIVAHLQLVIVGALIIIFLDRRAARHRPAVARGQRKTEIVAVPALGEPPRMAG